MVSSYEEIMGTPMDPGDHPATNVPDATEHHDGTKMADVTPGPSGGSGQDSRAVDYALGKEKDPKIKSIGMDALKGWAGRQRPK